MSAAHARHRLDSLLEERSVAHDVGLIHNATYMADLEADIAACRAAFMAAAVTERAMLQGAALGRNQG